MKTLVEYDHVRDTPDLSATSIKLHKLGFNGLIVDADFLSDPDAAVVAKHLGLPVVAASIPLEVLSHNVGDYAQTMRALGVVTVVTSWEAIPADGGLSSLTATEACLCAQGLRLAWHSRNIDLNTRNWRETIEPLLASIPNLDWIADLKGNVPEELEYLRANHTRAVGIRLPDLDYGPRGFFGGDSPGFWKTLFAELAAFPRLTFAIAPPQDGQGFYPVTRQMAHLL